MNVMRHVGLLIGLVTVNVTGCVTSSTGEGELPKIQTPDNNDDALQFCNPQGKAGAALKACIDQNEALYKGFDEEAKSREPWFNFTPDSWTDSAQVDAAHVLAVTNEGEAVKRLADKATVELSAADVKALTGKDVAPAGLKPYLVRALFYVKEGGEFSVFRKDSALLVQHDSIGNTATPKEQRTGLVVFLDAAPNPVYVDCSLAE